MAVDIRRFLLVGASAREQSRIQFILAALGLFLSHAWSPELLHSWSLLHPASARSLKNPLQHPCIKVSAHGSTGIPGEELEISLQRTPGASWGLERKDQRDSR